MPAALTHLDKNGDAHMVDVGAKPISQRRASAQGIIYMSKEAFDGVRNAQIKKGDVLAAARIAGIMAAKNTSALIPLCHPLMLTNISIDIKALADDCGFSVLATAKVDGKTGVEMEALMAASVACLTIYDMAKALDKHMVISEIKLLRKSGGKSGDWQLEG